MFTMHKHRGVTLVELMIAMVISTIVLLGVATVYSSTKRSYKVQEEMARLQENARYAFNAMASDIRGAGFIGCNPKITSLLDETDSDFDPALYDFQAGVDGWEFTANGTAPGDDYTITSLTNTGAAANWEGADWDGNGTGDDLADDGRNAVQVDDGEKVLAIGETEADADEGRDVAQDEGSDVLREVDDAPTIGVFGVGKEGFDQVLDQGLHEGGQDEDGGKVGYLHDVTPFGVKVQSEKLGFLARACPWPFPSGRPQGSGVPQGRPSERR